MSKADELAKLKEKVDADKTLPLRSGATQLVFGEGNPDSEIYLLGEAPGFYEDREGRPFVGLAGKLLTQLIEGLGLSRKDVYISNIVRFRPPGNRDPEPSEIAAFAPYVDEEIKIIEPKIIVTLGRFSMAKFLGPDVRISQIHGKKYLINWLGRDVVMLPMYHPAAALRSTEVMKSLSADFFEIKRVLVGEEKAEPVQKEEDNASQLDLF